MWSQSIVLQSRIGGSTRIRSCGKVYEPSEVNNNVHW